MNPKRSVLILAQLAKRWREENYSLFGDAMNPPSFELSEGVSALGSWDPQRRVISIQLELIKSASWYEVVEVLRHEMAHQYVSEQLKVRGEPPHGPSFREVCRARGIDARASGRALSPEAERLLERVKKLLALAESDNIHEAELAATQAQALIHRHHLKLSELERLDPERLSFESGMGARSVGEPKKRHYRYEYAITNLLCEHFFVDVIWVSSYDIVSLKEGRVAELCGRLEDLEIAEYVYHFIHNHLKIAWCRHKAKHSLKGLQERLSFSFGLVKGFQSKLDAQAESRSEELGLVLSSSEAASRFLRLRHPRVRSISSGGWSPTESFGAGFAVGQNLTLRRGVESAAHVSSLQLGHEP